MVPSYGHFQYFAAMKVLKEKWKFHEILYKHTLWDSHADLYLKSFLFWPVKQDYTPFWQCAGCVCYETGGRKVLNVLNFKECHREMVILILCLKMNIFDLTEICLTVTPFWDIHLCIYDWDRQRSTYHGYSWLVRTLSCAWRFLEVR